MLSQIPISLKILKFLLRIISLVQKTPSKTYNLKPNNSPLILCYHNITNSPTDPFTVSTKDFINQIDYLKRIFNVLPLSELLNSFTNGSDKSSVISHKQSLAVGNGKLSITFDDGYKNLLNKAFPVLNKANIKPYVFLNSPNLPDRLSVQDIQKLHSNGWEFGMHTLNHEDLTHRVKGVIKEGPTLKDPSGSDPYVEKQHIEKLLGFPLPYFSYPFNKYSSEVVKALQNAGYKAAFTANGGYANFTNPFTIDRIIIPNHLTIKEFSALLTPRGIAINKVLTRILRIKDKFMSY